MLLFLLRLLISDFLYLILSDESSTLNDESGDDGYDSRSSSKYSFPAFFLCFEYSVVCFSPLGYSGFVPTGFQSKCDTASRSSVTPTQLAQLFVQSFGSSSGRQQGWSGYSISFVQNSRC